MDYTTNVQTRNFVSDRYQPDEEGNIRMSVNIWGHIKFPGNYLVYDGIDVITLFSLAGGIKDGANLKKIKIYREFPDSFGQQAFNLNLDNFYDSGNRQFFPTVLPNDTYYIPQKTSSYLISQTGLINTLINTVNLALLAIIRSNQATN